MAGAGLARNSGFPGFLTSRVSLPSPWPRTPARCRARMPGGPRPGPWNPARRPCRGISKRVAPSRRCGTVVTRNAEVSLVTGDCLRRAETRVVRLLTQRRPAASRTRRGRRSRRPPRYTRGPRPGCARASCTDSTGNNTDGARCAGIIRRPGPRTGPRPRLCVPAILLLCVNAGGHEPRRRPGWRSVTAYVAAPVFLAVITDRVIAVTRQHILPLDAESAWAPLGRAAVTMLRLAAVVASYLLRTVLAPSGTLRGLRQMVLDAAPVPGMTGSRQVCGEQLRCSDDQDRDQGAGQPVTGFGAWTGVSGPVYRRSLRRTPSRPHQADPGVHRSRCIPRSGAFPRERPAITSAGQQRRNCLRVIVSPEPVGSE